MRWPNVPLLATGSVVLAASYLPAMIVAVARDTKDDNDLYIPVAGPNDLRITPSRVGLAYGVGAVGRS